MEFLDLQIRTEEPIQNFHCPIEYPNLGWQPRYRPNQLQHLDPHRHLEDLTRCRQMKPGNQLQSAQQSYQPR